MTHRGGFPCGAVGYRLGREPVLAHGYAGLAPDRGYAAKTLDRGYAAPAIAAASFASWLIGGSPGACCTTTLR